MVGIWVIASRKTSDFLPFPSDYKARSARCFPVRGVAQTNARKQAVEVCVEWARGQGSQSLSGQSGPTAILKQEECLTNRQFMSLLIAYFSLYIRLTQGRLSKEKPKELKMDLGRHERSIKVDE